MNVALLLRIGLAALLFGAGWTANGWRLGAQHEAAERAHAQQQTEVSRRVAQAEHNERAEEARRTDAMQEVANAARKAHDRDVSDRAAADLAHQRMLDAARASLSAARDAGPDPAAAERSQAAEDTAGAVYLDVLGRVDEWAGSLAAALDDARTAGLACERAYDALTAGRDTPGQVSD